MTEHALYPSKKCLFLYSLYSHYLKYVFLTQRQAASQRTVTQQAIWVGKLVWQIITSIGSDFFIRYGNLIFTLSIYKDQSPSIQTQY